MVDTSPRHQRMAALDEMTGMTLKRLQLLESAAAQFFTLTQKVEHGMGQEKGNSLLAKVKRETFGELVKKLTKAKILPEEVTNRFDALVTQRNWLVHNSLDESRKATLDQDCFEAFLVRLEKIVIENDVLLKEVRRHTEKFGESKGVSPTLVEAKFAETWKQWRG